MRCRESQFRLLVRGCMLLVLCVMGRGAASASCVDYGSYLHWIGSVALPGGAYSYNVAAAGNLAFVAFEGTLCIADVTLPESPQLVYTNSIGLSGLAARSNRLFTVSADPGLKIYDVSNPAAPGLVGSLSLPGGGYLVELDGPYAYVVGGLQLHIVNVSNEADPQLVSSLTLPNQPYGMVLRDGYAYLSLYGSGIAIVAVSDPLHPALVGALSRPEPNFGVAVAGSYLYLCGLSRGVDIIDVSNSAQPVLSGTVNTYTDDGGAGSVTVIGSQAYVACSPPTGSGSVQVYDVTNPGAPLKIGGIAPGGVVADAGSFACVASETALRTLATVNPASPPVLGSIALSVANNRVAVQGSAVCATAGNSGLKVIDCSNPASPFVAGIYNTPGEALDVKVSSTLAYVADGAGGLSIVDVSLPSAPNLVGSLLTSGAQMLDVSGSYLYLADGWGGFKVVRISDPVSPVLVGSVPLQLAGGVLSLGNHVLVAEGQTSTMHVIDVSIPSAPHIVASRSFSSGLGPFAAYGSVVFVGTGDRQIHVYEFSDPVHPVWLRTLSLSDYAKDLFVRGSVLYVTGGYMGMLAFDVSNPSTPRLVGSVNTPRSSYGVCADEDYAFVTHSNGVMSIVPASCQFTTDLPGGNPGTAGITLLVAPNPMIDVADLRYRLPSGAPIDLAIFDAGGRRVRGLSIGWNDAGSHLVAWNRLDDSGRPVPAGVYLSRLRTGTDTRFKTIVVLK